MDAQLNAWQTTLQAAQANTLASSSVMVAHLNSELRTLYLGRFNDWVINVTAGRVDNSNPPKPPAGYEVVTGPDGFAWPAAGSTPVCDMPKIPDDRSKSQPPLNLVGDAKRNVPPDDTMPVGYEATAPDGSKWIKRESPTPFGVAHYYEREA